LLHFSGIGKMQDQKNKESSMRELTFNEVNAIAAAGSFSYGELTGAVVAGAITGGMTGSLVGGLGAGPGAVAGAAIGGMGYTAGKLVKYMFDNSN
jgi:hypothetical protein